MRPYIYSCTTAAHSSLLVGLATPPEHQASDLRPPSDRLAIPSCTLARSPLSTDSVCGAHGHAVLVASITRSIRVKLWDPSGKSLDGSSDMKRKPQQQRVPSRAIEFLPRRFFFLALRETQRLSLHDRDSIADENEIRLRFPRTPGIQFVSLDDLLWPEDYSSNELHQTVRFCDFLADFLPNSSSGSSNGDGGDNSSSAVERIPNSSSSRQSSGVWHFYLRRHNVDAETRAIHLICRWRLLQLQLSPQDAVAPFEHLSFLFPTIYSTARHPISESSSQLPNLLLSLRGFAKGLEMELLGSAASALDALRLHVGGKCDLGTLKCGSLMWITSGLVIFADSQDPSSTPEAAVPVDEAQDVNDQVASSESASKIIAPLLKQQNVVLVVRLGRLSCDESVFAESGIEVVDLSPPPAAEITEADGEVPSEPSLHDDGSVLKRLLDACESAGGAVSVHSSAGFGSGRAATYIGCYLMKHQRFTSHEASAWLSLCCSSSLTLVRRLFLERMQMRMWRDGDNYRRLANEANSAASVAHSSSSLPLADSLQINIGNISLGRSSLFGTKANGHANSSREPQTGTAHDQSGHSPQHLYQPQQPLHMKRRPLTQGSGGRRPRLQSGTSGGVLRADFAQMHKFLHQTGSSAATTATTPRTASMNGTLVSSSSADASTSSVRMSETVRRPSATAASDV